MAARAKHPDLGHRCQQGSAVALGKGPYTTEVEPATVKQLGFARRAMSMAILRGTRAAESPRCVALDPRCHAPLCTYG